MTDTASKKELDAFVKVELPNSSTLYEVRGLRNLTSSTDGYYFFVAEEIHNLNTGRKCTMLHVPVRCSIVERMTQ